MHELASRRFFITVAVPALLALAAFLITGPLSPALADDEDGLGEQIAHRHAALVCHLGCHFADIGGHATHRPPGCSSVRAVRRASRP